MKNQIPKDKKISFTVYVDDNYHFMDEDERYTLGVFDTEEEAIKAAKAVIDEFLLKNISDTKSAEKLYEGLCIYGEDPWISPPGSFHAWDYAKKM
jgi:hypothetical protein